MRILPLAMILSMLVLWTSGCDRSKPSAPTVRKQSTKKTPSSMPTAFGTIKGRVRLLGWDKPPAKLPDEWIKAGPKDLVDESIVQDSQRNLRYVVLSILDCPDTGKARTETVVLDQINLNFVPHVLAVQVGETLAVRNSDDTIHNVHMLTEKNPPVNIAMPRPETRYLKMKEPEIFPVKCDVHPWEKAYIAVFDHPCFAVSAADGTFEIKNAPAGEWTLVAWHEKFREIEQTVNVPANGTVTVEITYQAPTE
jgi:plastocyanin